MITLVVRVYFDTDDLPSAYLQFRNIMDPLEAGQVPTEGAFPDFLGWETSDEWYRGADEHPGDPKGLQEAIQTCFRRVEDSEMIRTDPSNERGRDTL